jgi:hypothetical protein
VQWRIQVQAKGNLFNLSLNPYPGRGIVCGLDETGEFLVQVYWIMGRSENSRNRVFVCPHLFDGLLSTEAADPSKVKDPSLIIYNAMNEVLLRNDTVLYVVSNGSQTDDVASETDPAMSLNDRLLDFEYEPDEPNFTPRITATSSWDAPVVSRDPWLLNIEMSILRKSMWSNECDRLLYNINDVGKGYGYCFHTYACDGEPLPAFHGEPYLLPLQGDASQIASKFWETLDPDNRVSLAVKFIPRDGPSHIVIINKYAKA